MISFVRWWLFFMAIPVAFLAACLGLVAHEQGFAHILQQWQLVFQVLSLKAAICALLAIGQVYLSGWGQSSNGHEAP